MLEKSNLQIKRTSAIFFQRRAAPKSLTTSSGWCEVPTMAHLHIAARMNVNVTKTILNVKEIAPKEPHALVGLMGEAFKMSNFQILAAHEPIGTPREGGLLGAICRLIKKIDLSSPTVHFHTHYQDTELSQQFEEIYPWVTTNVGPVIWHCYDRAPYVPHLPGAIVVAGGEDCRHAFSPDNQNCFVSNSSWPASIFKNESMLHRHWPFLLASTLSDKPNHFRNWLPILKELHTPYRPVRVWSGSHNLKEVYAPFCDWCGFTNPLYLLDILSLTQWAICGSPPGHREPLQTNSMPNKIFDAIAACTPIVYFNRNDIAAKWVEENEFGIVVDSVPELLDKLNHMTIAQEQIYRKSVAIKRFNYSALPALSQALFAAERVKLDK